MVGGRHGAAASVELSFLWQSRTAPQLHSGQARLRTSRRGAVSRAERGYCSVFPIRTRTQPRAALSERHFPPLCHVERVGRSGRRAPEETRSFTRATRCTSYPQRFAARGECPSTQPPPLATSETRPIPTRCLLLLLPLLLLPRLVAQRPQRSKCSTLASCSLHWAIQW